MSRKACFLAVLLLTVTALHGAVADPVAPAPLSETEALLQAIFGVTEAPAAGGIEGAVTPLPEFMAGTVPCCRPAPCGCLKTETAEACEAIGGTVYSSTQDCAASCCW